MNATNVENGQATSALKLTNVEDIYPLSPMQQGMLLHSLNEPRSGMYFIELAFRIDVALDVRAFRRAWEEVLRRHAVLRTGFLWEDLNKPMQVVREKVELPWREEDWRGQSESEQKQRWKEFLREDREQGFDLKRAPLLRLALMRIGDKSYYFAWNSHHILLDGWCRQIVFGEALALYEAFREGRVPQLKSPRPYRDYIAWLQKQDEKRAEAFWREALKGFSVPTRLAIGREGRELQEGKQEFGNAVVQTNMNKEATEKLKEIARGQQVTLNTLIQGVWALLLSRYSREEDVVFGATVSGRAGKAGFEETVGLFINTLPVRTQLRGGESIPDYLKRLQRRQSQALDYEYTPLLKVQAVSEIPRGTPLFETVLVFENYPIDTATQERAAANMNITSSPGIEVSNYPLMLGCSTDPVLTLLLDYDLRFFATPAMERLLGHLEAALDHIASDPEGRVGNVSLLTEAERYQLLVQWNLGSQHVPYRCAHELFEEQVEKHPQVTALVFEDEVVSYADLNARANQLAHYLAEIGVVLEERVGVCLRRSPDFIVGLLAILKSGGAYAALDVNTTPGRLRFAFNDAQVRIVLADSTTEERIHSSGWQGRILFMDREKEKWMKRPVENLGRQITPENLLYVIYTSGSTGEPKGTEIPHRSLPGFIWDVEYAAFDEQQTLLQHSSVSWDALTLELWPALLRGGCCVLYSGEMLIPEELGRLVRKYPITTLWLTSSLFTLMIATDPKILGGVRQVMSGGETLSVEHVRQALKQLPDLRLVNGYGPSECTVFSTCHVVPRNVPKGMTSLSLGHPIGDRKVYVLDSDMNLAPVGVPGEVYVGGRSVARGYLNRPAMTAEKFVPDPFSDSKGGRLFRTGDLARWQTSGDLEFLGRTDEQIKIRGFRVELGEIETVLAQHERVRECAVVVCEDTRGDKRLVAYVVKAGIESLRSRELRSYLKGRLPEYMVPATFMEIAQLPLTPHGKLDRRALPEPSLMGDEQEHKGPRDAEEEILSGIFSEVLNQARVGIEDDFFELGGHSLLATKVISRVRSAFHVELPLRAILDAPTVEGLAEWVRSGLGAKTAPVLVRVDRGRSLPLSFAQQRLWFIDQLESGSAAYNLPFGLRFNGDLDREALEWSVQEIVRRHEVLRTRFTERDGMPVQEIVPELKLQIEDVDLSSKPEEEREAEGRRLGDEDAVRPFDLSQAPLVRMKLLRLGNREHIVLVNMHHIVSDGWSMAILVREFIQLYRARVNGAESPLPELPLQYADFAIGQREWLQGEVLEEQMGYWKRQLEGLHLLEMPTDHLRPAIMSRRGGMVTVRWDQQFTSQLKGFSRREGVTLFMTLLAAFQVMLGRYAGQDDVAVGTAIANRNRQEIEDLIGFFVNTLVLRTDLSGRPSFRELLARVRQMVLGAYKHQDLPFENVVGALVTEHYRGRSPLFQVMLVLQNLPWEELKLPGLNVTQVDRETNLARFDLSLVLNEAAEGISAELSYGIDLYEPETAERMLRHLQAALEQLLAAPQRSIRELSLLGQVERDRMLVDWNLTAVAYAQEKCIHQLFEEQAERTPETMAVECGTRSLTYRELNQRANQLAHYLRKLGVGLEIRVGLCMDRSLEMVVGFLGILKAGGVYVPLDPAHPSERLTFIVEDAQVVVLLIQESLRERLSPLRVQMLALDIARPEAEELGNLGSTIASENLAYLLYTSGSTGSPKGVQVQHQGLVNLALAQQRLFAATVGDRILQFASLSFDASVWEMCMALTSGACLIVSGRADSLLAANLGKVMSDERITIATLAPSVLGAMETKEMPALSRLILAGEALPQELAREWSVGRRFFNAYGPTEGTVCATVLELRSGCEERPFIGSPIANTQVYVLGDDLEPAPLGVVGELFLSGPGLARGYLNRSDLTAEKFLPNQFSGIKGSRMYRTGDRARWRNNGNLEFLGRADRQVKVRGCRIELEEIEAMLMQSANVCACAVVVREDKPEEKLLVAYVVAKDQDEKIVGAELREHLRQKLPEYMIPSVYVQMNELPLTPANKIDRKSLPQPETRQVETDLLPADQVEFDLVRIWKDLLKVPNVGRDQTFFELGGHSLLALKLTRLIKEKFAVDLPLSAVIEAATIEKLGMVLRRGYTHTRGSNLVPLQPRGSRRPLYFVHPGGGGALGYLGLARLLGDDQPFYGFQALDEEEAQMERIISIEERAEKYLEALRKVQPHGPYSLGGWSFGGYVAYEMAQQLWRQNEEVDPLFLLDVNAQPAAEVMHKLKTLQDDAEFLLDATRESGQLEFSLQPVEHETPQLRLRYVFDQLLNARILPPETELSNVLNFINGTRRRGQSVIDYRFRPYPGTITLVRASEQAPPVPGADLNPDDPTAGFAKLSSRPVQVHFVPGANHYNLIFSPHVEKLTAIVSACLQDAALEALSVAH